MAKWRIDEGRGGDGSAMFRDGDRTLEIEGTLDDAKLAAQRLAATFLPVPTDRVADGWYTALDGLTSWNPGGGYSYLIGPIGGHEVE